ncbi:MAG: GerAB/ArcD/ProY family transporter [Christensenellales bacterium]
MNDNSISARNMGALMLLMVLCGSLISGAFTVLQDTWIVVLLMGALFLPVISMYARICALFPGKGLFEIIESLFGRAGSFCLILLMSLYAVLTGALVLQNYTEFTVVISLEATPKIPIMIVLMLPTLYLAKKGPGLLGRWSLIVCGLILVQFAVTLMLSFHFMEPQNTLPMLDHAPLAIVADSYAIGCIAIGETVIAMALFGSLKKGDSSYRAYLPGVLLGALLFALTMLRDLLILGAELEQAAKFSTYMAVRIIKVGNFLERIESSISFIYVLLGITKLSLYLMAASMGIARLLKSANYRNVVVPTGLLMIAVSAITFKNLMEMYDFVWAYRFLNIPFQLLIPLLIWIVAEVRIGWQKRRAVQRAAS